MDANEATCREPLSDTLPTAADAASEIVLLTGALNLLKPVEVYASDIHGEYATFSHLLRNGSGVVRKKIDDALGDVLADEDMSTLATLIYYPGEKLEIELGKTDDADAFYLQTLPLLVEVCKQSAMDYTREKVRAAMPDEFAAIMDELMDEGNVCSDRLTYYAAIVKEVIAQGKAGELAVAFCKLIQRLAIDHLHMVGDVYDRGPAPHLIMDELMDFHSLDIQWGNHDMVWMGAALGQRGCIAHVVRNCARYANLGVLEDVYGIDLQPLRDFALSAYADDPCVAFGLKGNPDLPEDELQLNVKIQKAMAMLQFKVEAALIDEYPSFELDDRKLLDKVDYERGTVVVDGVEYELADKVFPTVDPADPFKLTAEEETVMQQLACAFVGCDMLQRHMELFRTVGSLYKIENGTLMFHAGVPLNDDGSLKEVSVFGETFKGRALYDACERYVRAAYESDDADERKRGRDFMWWLWLSPGSPLFAKSKMATFELYLITEKAARKEVKNPFYTLLDDEGAMAGIFEDFGMNPATSRIVCGHVPVKVKDGEKPIKCNGHVLCIDGGFSRAYQPTTGIAGFTVVSDSHGVTLYAHRPLESTQAAIEGELDIDSEKQVVEDAGRRLLVNDTDEGARIRARIAELRHAL